MLRLRHAALIAIVAALARAQAPAAPADLARVDEAIERGIRWLLERQEVDGSWRGPEPAHYHGMTSLAVYTLLKGGLDPAHPAVRCGVAELGSAPLAKTYDQGAALMALGALGEKRPLTVMQDLAGRLVRSLGNGTKKAGARWGYPNDHPGLDDRWTDLSNTQYAVLGLRAARQAGQDVGNVAFWTRIAEDLLDGQEAYGGFGYRYGEKPSSSMTLAGMTVLWIAQEVLGSAIDPGLRARIQTGIRGADRWMAAHWAVDRMIDLRLKEGVNDRWLYYYLYGLERFGSYAGLDRIGGHEWYPEGALELLKRQQDDGSWEKDDASTCFALIFLRRGSRASGLLPRAQRREAEAEEAALAIGTDGRNPATVWVRGLGAEVRQALASGAVIERLQWVVGDQVVGAAPVATTESLLSPEHNLRYVFDENGAHVIEARLLVAPAPGSEGPTTFRSNALTVTVDDVELPWHREAMRDAGRNLLGAASAASSSALDGDRIAARAVDRQAGTSWICDARDREPWIQVTLERGARANVLKLTSGSCYAESDGWFGRPKDVELRINNDPPRTLRLADAVRRKQWLSFPKKTVRSVRIRILSLYPGERHPNAAGFKEIELHLDESGAQEDGPPRARGVEVVLPLAHLGETAWRYTTKEPPPSWTAPDFRDLEWPKGRAGFGSREDARAPSRTRWAEPEIWLRTTFHLDDPAAGELLLEVNHDDDAEVHLNGVLAARCPGWSLGGHRTFTILPEARAALVPGPNVLAVHCRNVGGPGYIDVGIVRLLAPVELR